MNKKIEAIFFVLLFLGTMWIWTLPFQKNRMPYGDVDSSTHFGLADYMSSTDRSMYYLPYFFNQTYYSKLNDGKVWYMPQIHTDAAILQIVGGERVLPIFLFWSLICSSVVLTTTFFVRKLYGQMCGFIAGFFMLFSIRDIMWFLWGQYLQGLSFALVPLVIYFYYMYLESTLEKPKSYYLYIVALLVACQFLIHPQAILISLLVASIYTALFIFKQKSFPFRIKDIVICVLIILILLIPFFRIVSGGEKSSSYNLQLGFKPDQLNTLSQWYPTQIPGGVPPYYYSFGDMIGKWTIPFILASIVFLILNRKNKDLLMLSLLIAFYLCMHQSIIGLGRAERFIQAEALVIYPIASVGIFYLTSLIKSHQKYIKPAVFIVVLLVIAVFNGRQAYSQLNNAYGGILRISANQYAATEWMRDSLPYDAEVFIRGQAVYSTKKWIQALSFKHMDWDSKTPENNTYALIDYSDMAMLGAGKDAEALQQIEKEFFSNSTLLYNKNYIRVYKIG